VHIPGYVREMEVLLNGEKIDWKACMQDGYCCIRRVWGEDESLEFRFDMEVRKVYANQRVREDAGCVALMRGPFVYCFEGVDNEGLLQSAVIPKQAQGRAYLCEEGILKGKVLIEVKGFRYEGNQEELYSEEVPVKKEKILRAVPYYTWGNRGENQMRVWMRTE